jgi:membrane protease YdiL (CAAX protease family)
MWQRRPVLTFLLLAYSVTWIFRVPLAASSAGLTAFQVPRFFQFLGDFGPLIAAVWLSSAEGGRRKVADLLRQVLHWRVPLRWYALALAGPPVLFGLSALLSHELLGAPLPDWSQFGRWPELPSFSRLATWTFLVVTIGLGEEVGWRGYAQPRLQARYGFLRASLVVGVAWVFWHAPTFVFDEAFAAMLPWRAVGWALLLIAGSVVLGWLYNSSGSLLIPILFHGTQDFTMGSLAAREETLGTVWAVLFLLVTAAVVVLSWRRQRSSAARSS